MRLFRASLNFSLIHNPSNTGEDLAEAVRKHHLPDFSNWKNHDAFARAFARLEKDLRVSVS
jgi:hypothetical protein